MFYQVSSKVGNDMNEIAENDLFGDVDDDDLLDGAIGPDIPSVDQGEISENEFHARLDDDDEPKGKFLKKFPFLAKSVSRQMQWL